MSMTSTRSACLLLSIMALSACSTTNPYTQEQQTSKATKGAAIGAAVGVAAGLLTGDDADERRKRALIGAGVGALSGGGVGYYMDQQEAKLRAQLAGTGVGVTRVGQNIVLNMPGPITFRTGSADLNPQFFPVLDSVAVVLKEYDKTLVDVVGHTDSVGADDYNMLLSQQRANSVSQYLISRQISGMRIRATGLGEGYPVADNATEAGRAANRRVEITLAPLTS
ncbi:MAG: OmpA family protein [Pseudomonadota bacterium]|nr:OmpA family protein [Pseudomonadota bacterium]